MSVSPSPVGAPGPTRSRFLARPSTPTGQRAARLSAGVLGLIVLDAILAAAGAYDWSRPVRAALLGVTSLAILLGSIAATVITVLALRRGDRSIVLLWPLLIGAVAIMFIVGEFAFPH